MGTIKQPRVKAGIPTGGQWSSFEHGEPGVSLTDSPSGAMFGDARAVEQRIMALRSEGYVPAAASAAGDDPRSSSGRSAWWSSHFMAAEYGAAEGDYPQMPDDYTPKRTAGRALSGNRRTHRMSYKTADGSFTLRMPSATSIKSYESEAGSTFDLPVSAADADGNSASGWVRVTRSGRNWTVTELGEFGDATGQQVSEAVSSVLEARRPSRALSNVGSLLDKHKKRIAKQGDEFLETPSSFISGVGYSDETGTMAVAIRDKLYGYQVPKESFQAVATAHSPGVLYNKLVKGNDRTELERCGDCGRFYTSDNGHTCEVAHKARPSSIPLHNRAAREAAARHLVSTGAIARAGSTGSEGADSGSIEDPDAYTGPDIPPEKLAAFGNGPKDTEISLADARKALDASVPGSNDPRIYGVGVFDGNPAPQIVRIHSSQKLDDRYKGRIAKAWVSGTTVSDLIRPARNNTHTAPAGKHTPAPAGTAEINLGNKLNAMCREPLQTFGQSSPEGYRRAWTCHDKIVDAIGPHTSEHYVPHSYQGNFSNGLTGLIDYDGINGDDARALVRAIPDRELDSRKNGAPTLGSMLVAAGNHPGRVEVGGYVVGPDRIDERVTADSLSIYADTDLDADTAWASASSKLGFQSDEPDGASLTEHPWRPGEKCWTFWWD